MKILSGVFTLADERAVGRTAAGHITAALHAKPDLILCAASGMSPLGTYEELVRVARREPKLFRAMRVVKLDEWGGLGCNHPATCEMYVRTRLLEPLEITPERYIGFESNPADPNSECARVADALAAWGSIDISVLGIGLNGHVGLNEPAPALHGGCHVAELSDSTKSHGMLSATGAAPEFGLTLGMRDICHSASIVLVALGDSKRVPVAQMWSGAVSTEFPASLLTLHPNLALLTDIDFRQDELNGVTVYRDGHDAE